MTNPLFYVFHPGSTKLSLSSALEDGAPTARTWKVNPTDDSSIPSPSSSWVARGNRPSYQAKVLIPEAFEAGYKEETSISLPRWITNFVRMPLSWKSTNKVAQDDAGAVSGPFEKVRKTTTFMLKKGTSLLSGKVSFTHGGGRRRGEGRKRPSHAPTNTKPKPKGATLLRSQLLRPLNSSSIAPPLLPRCICKTRFSFSRRLDARPSACPSSIRRT